MDTNGEQDTFLSLGIGVLKKTKKKKRNKKKKNKPVIMFLFIDQTPCFKIQLSKRKIR